MRLENDTDVAAGEEETVKTTLCKCDGLDRCNVKTQHPSRVCRKCRKHESGKRIFERWKKGNRPLQKTAIRPFAGDVVGAETASEELSAWPRSTSNAGKGYILNALKRRKK